MLCQTFFTLENDTLYLQYQVKTFAAEKTVVELDLQNIKSLGLRLCMHLFVSLVTLS